MSASGRQFRILHLTTDSFGAHGGIALYNRDLIEAMASHPRVGEVVVLPRHVTEAPGRLPGKVTLMVEGAGGKRAWMRALLAILVRRRDFDVVVCGHLNLLPAAWLAAKVCATRPVLLLYGIEAWEPPPSGVVCRLVRAIESHVSISDITRLKFTRWAAPEAPGALLPNAIHLERYAVGTRDREMESRYGLEGKRVVMTLGRIVKEERYKGFDEVLAVLPSILRDAPDVVYVIAGDGNDRPRLEALVASMGLTGHVVFTRFVAESEKAALYSLADVYVMPSRGEGFGFVFLEAMASGVPVIGSLTDGGREALRDGALGLLVDPDDGAALERGIMTALTLRQRQIPVGLDYFSFANFERRCHDILDGILHRRGLL